MRSPPQCQPPPEPPDELISVFNVTSTSTTTDKPRILDCGADGHLVTSTRTLRHDTIRPSSMKTQAFSGATAAITHTGDHRSGLFPNCHVCPISTFNLVAVGPYLDTNPNCAVVLTPNLALQLKNLDFDIIAKSAHPRKCLLAQLQATDERGNHRVTIDTIGTRDGPNSLYRTNLFDLPDNPNLLRTRLINSAMSQSVWATKKLPGHLLRLLPTPTTTGTPPPKLPTPKPTTTTTTTTRNINDTSLSDKTKQPDQASHAHIAPDLSWTTSTTTERALIELRQLHCALGHPSNGALIRALEESPSKHHHHLRKYVKLMDKCNMCPAGTQHALSHPDTATTRAELYLQRLILDCSGRQPVATTGGAWFFLLIVDDATRMKWIRFLKSISQVPTIFDDFLRSVVRQGTLSAAGTVRSVSLVRTDNGPDFNSDRFRQVLRLHSITHEPSPPDASQQRGIAERGIGVISPISRSNLYWALASLPFWGEAANHANTTSNNLPNSSNPGNKSPYQMANPSKPSQLPLLRPFGCLAFIHVPVGDRNGKMNPASNCAFFAGYGLTPDGQINGYRVMNFRTQRFTTRFNVVFNEQLPALRYILSALVNSPQQLLVGRTVRKRFDSGTFTGTIISHSTEDNLTLYDIKYDDGDTEQMDLMDVLKHITPVQEDMTIHKPHMHKRLQQASPNDRARIGKDLLPATTRTAPTTTGIKITYPSRSKVFLRRSTRRRRNVNKLTSTTLGKTADTAKLPLPLRTHTPNKANTATFTPHRAQTEWRRAHVGQSRIILMTTMLVNAVTNTMARPAPNAVINGIHIHRYPTVSPPLPTVPARDVPPPDDYDDAVDGPYRMHWRPAIQREIDSLFHYGVWRLERLPPGALVLPCKMVFKVKPDGKDPPGISKFKCRYCGKGYLQRKGVHYLCSWAPVAAAVTSRLIVAFATEMNWPLHGMDVRNAYLNADLHPSVVLFVQPPPTVHVPRGYGLRLVKGLYGTMQGGNRWAVHKHIKLTQLGYERNTSEPSMYHRFDKHGIVIMALIVDDFEITGYPPSAVAFAKLQLSNTWDMTDLGPLKYFANIEIKRDRVTKQTTLKQTNYIEDMLARYDLQDSYPKATPCTTSIYEQRLLDPVSPHAPMFNNDYSQQVGTLGYLRRTRPDLCVALGVSAQFSKLGRHGLPHYRALRNIMRYCKPTKHHGLLFTSTNKRPTDPWEISGHADSDWASWKATRRSRMGWLIYLQKCLISFGSKLQTSVAMSSAEAEYMSLSHIIKILLWIIHIIEGIPGQFVRKPVPIYIDNKPAINLADNHAASKFTRHIGIAHHFLRDHCAGGDRLFSLIWRQSKFQVADGMTKPLPRAAFVAFRDNVVSDIRLPV